MQIHTKPVIKQASAYSVNSTMEGTIELHEGEVEENVSEDEIFFNHKSTSKPNELLKNTVSNLTRA